MAEAASRFRETSGSDVVRRLIARPIRLDPPRVALAPTAFEMRAEALIADAAEADAAVEGIDAEDAGFDDEDAGFDDEAEDGVVERLQAEMVVMKAILTAERAEVASLRARIALHVEPEPIGEEARATRERWAGMVDRLLMSPR